MNPENPQDPEFIDIQKLFEKPAAREPEPHPEIKKRNVLKRLGQLKDMLAHAKARAGQKSLVRHHYEDGTLRAETHWEHGKKNGAYRRYDPEGRLYEEGLYQNDELAGLIRQYYSNGRLKGEVNHAGGKKNGVFRTYYESGVLRQEGYYENDVVKGLVRNYHLNGQVAQETRYEDGKLSGICRWYDEEGNIIGEERH